MKSSRAGPGRRTARRRGGTGASRAAGTRARRPCPPPRASGAFPAGAFAAGASPGRGPPGKSQRDGPRGAPCRPCAPVSPAAWTAPVPAGGFPALGGFLLCTVPFAGFETRLTFGANIPRSGMVQTRIRLSGAPRGPLTSAPPRARRHGRGAGTSRPLAYVTERGTPEGGETPGPEPALGETEAALPFRGALSAQRFPAVTPLPLRRPPW